MLGHGQAGQGHPHTDAGGLVHLAEDQGGLVGDAALVHLAPQVVALTAALADAGEDGIAAVLHGNVVDQLLDQDGLADAGAAEQADLAAFGVGLQQVDDLDAGLQDLNSRVLLLKGRGFAVNALDGHIGGQLLAAVDGLAQDVEHPAQDLFAHRHLDGVAGGGHFHAAGQAFAGCQHDAPDGVAAHVLGNFHHPLAAVHSDGQGLTDAGQGQFFKGNIHNRARDLYDFACIQVGHTSFRSLWAAWRLCRWAFAPADTSVISRVMAA